MRRGSGSKNGSDDAKVSPEFETIPYQVDVPKPLWKSWKGSIPHSRTVKQSLFASLAEDIRRSENAKYDPHLGLNVITIDRSLWDPWKNTIPRSQPIEARLETLIKQDYRAATRDADVEEVGAKMLGTFATRIRIRGLQALGAIQDENDMEKAVEQVQEIIDMADVLER